MREDLRYSTDITSICYNGWPMLMHTRVLAVYGSVDILTNL